MSDLVSLSPDEVRRMRALSDTPSRLRRHGVIRREGDPVEHVYLLLDGWVASSITLPSGLRQIVKVNLPGDMLGAPSMALTRAADTLTALTEVTIARVPLTRFGALFASDPRLAAVMMIVAQLERVALMDTLVSVGRTSARERTATFLLGVHDRLLRAGAAEADRFHLPLTQEQIGDILGLTAVHVNRMVRTLEREGLIVRQGNTIILSDPARLRRLSPLPQRVVSYDAAWLPQRADDAAVVRIDQRVTL